MGLRTGASSYNSSPVTEIVNLKEKSHIFIQFPFNWLDNLNFVQHRQLFISNIQFAAHFIAPWTLLPGQPHESPPRAWPLACSTKYMFMPQQQNAGQNYNTKNG